MQALRTALSGGQLFVIPFKLLLLSPPAFAFSSSSFISLVPTQLQRCLQAGHSSWLRQFTSVLLGGAPCWPDLLNQAVRAEVPICLSYGMTETAAMVTARAAGDLQSDSNAEHSGMAMPHATICIERFRSEYIHIEHPHIERSEQRLLVGAVGQIVVRSAAIARGYYNAPSASFAPGTFYTDDLGYLDAMGRLHVTGRISGKIISGGENIFPAEVETAIRRTGLVNDVCVFGLPHPEWGEAIRCGLCPALLRRFS